MCLLICICGIIFYPQNIRAYAIISDVNETAIFLTGNELGAIQPCGCSGGQLGGLDRRGRIFECVLPERRMIIDTGSLVEGLAEQDLIKFNIILTAYDLIGYDAVRLSHQDFEIAEMLGSMQADYLFKPFTAVAESQKPPFVTKDLVTENGLIRVMVAAVSDAREFDFNSVFSCSGKGKVNIAIMDNCDPNAISRIRSAKVVDCVICPSEADEPVQISDKGDKPLIITTGRLGKYVVKLNVLAGTCDHPDLRFNAIAVDETLKQDEALVSLYRVYQQLVKDTGLLGNYPKFSLPQGLEYVGSRSCRMCHGYEYDKWSTKAHAHAYNTLVDAGVEYDPECVICHVVGMEYESGYVNETSTPHLKDVGCENCHGPGSEHIKSGGTKPPADPKMTCLHCHTPDHSAEYLGNESEYRKKIIHWREPDLADDVKKK
jgi:hypothetical protein